MVASAVQPGEARLFTDIQDQYGVQNTTRWVAVPKGPLKIARHFQWRESRP